MVELVCPVLQDAYVAKHDPDGLYGSAGELIVDDHPTWERRSFIDFDISGLPAGAVVSRAAIVLNLWRIDGADTHTMRVEQILEDWSEDTICFSDMPDVSDTGYHAFVAPSVVDAWYSIPITTLFSEFREGGVFSVCLFCDPLTPGGSLHRYRSSEHSDEPYLVVEYEYAAGLGFADVAVSRRYGERLYLSGAINDIVEADEICVYYSRPGDTGIRNLKSDTSDYLYFKGASGSYDLGAANRYIEFERAGYHWLQIWDVVGNCETPLTKRAEWLMDIVLPRFQYQVIFDLDDPDIVDTAWRLEAEYAKYEAAGSWFINHEKPDCFTHIQPINTPEDDTPQSGWLSLGVEFGESPCAPIPYYLCPLPTPQTQYWRGECSCDLFKNTLQPLGIPCSHLIAAMNWYSGEPAWSKYIQCP